MNISECELGCVFECVYAGLAGLITECGDSTHVINQL